MSQVVHLTYRQEKRGFFHIETFKCPKCQKQGQVHPSADTFTCGRCKTKLVMEWRNPDGTNPDRSGDKVRANIGGTIFLCGIIVVIWLFVSKLREPAAKPDLTKAAASSPAPVPVVASVPTLPAVPTPEPSVAPEPDTAPAAVLGDTLANSNANIADEGTYRHRRLASPTDVEAHADLAQERKAMGWRVLVSPAIGASSEEKLHDVMSMLQSGDEDALRRVIAMDPGVIELRKGTEVHVEDVKLWRALVRVRPRGAVRSYWIPSELISR